HYLEEAESLCRNIGSIAHGRLIENTSMKQLLRKMHRETFVLDTAQPVYEIPAELEAVRRIDDTTLEADVERGDNLSRLFTALDLHGIVVTTMRNKPNRLEQPVIDLVRNRGEARR